MSVLCYHEGVYNFYNQVSDGFNFESGLTEEHVRIYIKREYGNRGLEALPRRMERAKEHGHSSTENCTLEDFLICNRAGPNEEFLPFKKVVEKYFTVLESEDTGDEE